MTGRLYRSEYRVVVTERLAGPRGVAEAEENLVDLVLDGYGHPEGVEVRAELVAHFALEPGVESGPGSQISREIYHFGRPCTLACDARCDRAWGIQLRPRVYLGDPDRDPDDYYYLPDAELGDAPVEPGTYEGSCGKPRRAEDRLNKWCARQCERSVVAELGEAVVLPDLSRRSYNMPGSDPGQG